MILECDHSHYVTFEILIPYIGLRQNDDLKKKKFSVLNSPLKPHTFVSLLVQSAIEGLC